MKTTMKNLIAVLIFLVPVIASAQGRNYQKDRFTTEEKAEQMSKNMYARLDLSKEQLKEVEKINLKHSEERDKIHKEIDASRRKFQDEMKSLSNEHEESLMEVLTEEQFKELLTMQRRRRYDGKRSYGNRYDRCRYNDERRFRNR